MQDLLFEIGVEELPSGYIEPALTQLESGLRRRLEELRLGVEEVRTVATPRRLTLWAGGVAQRQAPVSEEVVGPPAHVAYDKDGNPTRAALGFARAQGVDPGTLEVQDSGKGPYVVALVEHEGREAMELLPSVLSELVREISFPKSMRWPMPPAGEDGGGQQLTFARPVRRLTALFGAEVVPVEIAGLEADRLTCGHPFLCQGDIPLQDASFDGYCKKLEKAFVIADCEERRSVIRRQAQEMETEHEKVDISEDLLDEVAGLVEYPCVRA